MLRSRLPQIAVQLEVMMAEAVEEGAEAVRDTAKANVARRTGALAAAIHVEDEPEGSYVVAGDGDVFYGHIVEHGSVNAVPRPFLVPALEANRERIARDAGAKLRRL